MTHPTMNWLPRAPYEEIADYISQEMALATKDLALTRGQNLLPAQLVEQLYLLVH